MLTAKLTAGLAQKHDSQRQQQVHRSRSNRGAKISRLSACHPPELGRNVVVPYSFAIRPGDAAAQYFRVPEKA